MSPMLKNLDLRPPFRCLELPSIISRNSYTATVLSLLLLTNFLAICRLNFDANFSSTARTAFSDGVSLNMLLHDAIGLILFEVFSHKNQGQNFSSSTFGISPVVEGEFDSSTYSPLADSLQNTERESLLAKLQIAWDEIGELKENRDRMISELEQKECLEAYKREIDEARQTKELMRQKIKDAITQLASVSSTVEGLGMHIDHLDRYAENLKEYLMMVTEVLARMRMEQHERRPRETPVILNIYDLTSANRLCYWAGIGAFHSGVEVYGVEYSFGAADFPSCGVSRGVPRKCPNYKFRKSVVVGTTSYSPRHLSLFMDAISLEYSGDSYNLIRKNCNHFSKDVCLRLTGKSVPKWINRLAKLGSRCCCV